MQVLKKTQFFSSCEYIPSALQPKEVITRRCYAFYKYAVYTNNFAYLFFTIHCTVS